MTDRRTHNDSIYRASIASRGKNAGMRVRQRVICGIQVRAESAVRRAYRPTMWSGKVRVSISRFIPTLLLWL